MFTNPTAYKPELFQWIKVERTFSIAFLMLLQMLSSSVTTLEDVISDLHFRLLEV